MDTENCTQGVWDMGLRDWRKVKEEERAIVWLNLASPPANGIKRQRGGGSTSICKVID